RQTVSAERQPSGGDINDHALGEISQETGIMKALEEVQRQLGKVEEKIGKVDDKMDEVKGAVKNAKLKKKGMFF
ncbi:hypothetical protein TrRE_jg13174, partial [Triparma retinervis]